MGNVDELASNFDVDAGHDHVELGAQEECAILRQQVDRGVHRRGLGQANLLLSRSNADRADEAAGPGSAEEVLGRRVRVGKLQVEEAVVAAGVAVGAADIVGGSGIDGLGSQGRSFRLALCRAPD